MKRKRTELKTRRQSKGASLSADRSSSSLQTVNIKVNKTVIVVRIGASSLVTQVSQQRCNFRCAAITADHSTNLLQRAANGKLMLSRSQTGEAHPELRYVITSQ